MGDDGAALINPNILNESGNTALHYACLNGKKECVQLFVAHNLVLDQIKDEKFATCRVDFNIKN